MIAMLVGEVAVRRADHVVLLAGGVGYRVSVSSETLRQVPAVGGQVTLGTQMIVREDSMTLFGFATEEERELFNLLLGVQSVGPKMALAVLSGGPPRELLAALAAGDTKRFQAVPGIGKRTAERIIVELREKVGVPSGGFDDAVAVTGVGTAAAEDPRAMARDGLLGLGFTVAEADRLLEGASGTSPEDLISHALREARR